MELTAPQEASLVNRGKQGGVKDSESNLLALHVSINRVHSKRVQSGVTGTLRPPGNRGAGKKRMNIAAHTAHPCF